MNAPAPGEPYLRRRVVDVVARGLCVLMFVLAVVPLLSLLAYVVKQGVGGLSWSFFTELPKPVGEVGGGMANALAGSAILVGLFTTRKGTTVAQFVALIVSHLVLLALITGRFGDWNVHVFAAMLVIVPLAHRALAVAARIRSRDLIEAFEPAFRVDI